MLGEQLRRSILNFYESRTQVLIKSENKASYKKENSKKVSVEYVHQCKHCLTIYEDTFGEPENGIEAKTPFNLLPDNYICSLCEAPKNDLIRVEKTKLGLQSV
ncbi:MAG: hypothetical protein NVS3B19_03820 [Ginsengibacter sp.]